MADMCLFGVSGAGKTCFIYAMSEVLRDKGARGNDMVFKLKANSAQQQVILNNGYLTLLDDQWPQPTNVPTVYDFSLKLQHLGEILDILPNLRVQDFRGGILDFGTKNAVAEYRKMLRSFYDSVAIVYIIDGITLSKALDEQYRNPARKVSLAENVRAQQQISIVDNLFLEFKKEHKDVPPVLIAISKDDVLTEGELFAGKEIIKGLLPSIFGRGSDTVGAITHFSLGVDLENGIQNEKLILTTERNLHIPVLFGAYAEFSRQYDEAPDEGIKEILWNIMAEMRNMFRGRLDIYVDGQLAKEI